MDTTSVNVGCGLIATAPVVAVHCVLISKYRFILIGWFSSFISTILLIFCSLSALFTNNPWYILLFSIPIDNIGKPILKYFGYKQQFLASPNDHSSLGLAMGMGYALAHVLILYLPMVFNQPFSLEFDVDHPKYLPNSLDLALSNHAMSIFHMATGILYFRFSEWNIFLMYGICTVAQFVIAAVTQIRILWLKFILLFGASYGLFFFAIYSLRSMKYTKLEEKDHDE
ncbi:hypothetical protein GPJ56_006590 [Histomonas meleagridis]|uniref:uncharacterized protein n=1 Tax=Histomonas meleagridis TaxID=135588 RepID=UPI0035594F09|nr:hypothetical protein GPJ56_006590 [Histomonas meleagridis]KAH0798422.1 hypothetical protein GO595_008814 [Histomonas meleagridis]